MKVAIIGAGINGLYLSWKLSEMGHQVTVFEKREKIGKEVCSGLISDRILEFIPESKDLIKNQIEHCLIHFSRKTVKINFSKNFFVISHYELDNLVVKLAENSGAKIILNHPGLTSVVLTSDINILLRRGFERIVGCDGANSEVRKSLGLKDPEFRLGIQGFVSQNDSSSTRAKRRVEMNECSSTFVETWPTKNGFLWKIPRGIEIEYGIIEKPKEAKEIFNKFLKGKNIQLEKINSALIPQGLIIPQNPRITLCGDAAGLTKPWSGGGVIWGLMAVDLLLKNFPDFLKYKNMVKEFFLPKIIFSKIAAKMIYFLGFNIPWILPREYKIEGDFLL